jgi:hypothetical protein
MNRHLFKASILAPTRPRDAGQGAAQVALGMGMTSSPIGFLACYHLSHPDAQSEPQLYRRHCPGDDDGQSHQHTRNPHSGAVMIMKDVALVLMGLA